MQKGIGLNMKQTRTIAFRDLRNADLMVDAVYEGGSAKNLGDDPISKLLGTSNQGGFRHRGSIEPSNLNLVGLVSNLEDPEWPDHLDVELGQFTYYGDNKEPGRELHETKKKGNLILKNIFDFLHSGERDKIPPIFVFTKGTKGRDVIFRGLAVPGAEGISSVEDLIAVWKARPEGRFQNYKAIFTILDASTISREWLEAIKQDRSFTVSAPTAWSKWLKTGIYSPLRAKRSRKYRKKGEQLPSSGLNRTLVKTIHEYFQGNSYAFERCAVELAKMMDKNIVECEVTRPWIDGGRDAVGKYRIGNEGNSIHVDFALEAKCYSFSNAVTLESTIRLISRLRHRQFGILVTTSYLHSQAYKEIIEDMHPVIVIAAEDIANILKESGYGTRKAVQDWLRQFPINK